MGFPRERRGGCTSQPPGTLESRDDSLCDPLHHRCAAARSTAIRATLYVPCCNCFVACPSGPSCGPGLRLVDQLAISSWRSFAVPGNLSGGHCYPRATGGGGVLPRARRRDAEHFCARQRGASPMDRCAAAPVTDYAGHASYSSFRRGVGPELKFWYYISLVGQTVRDIPPGGSRG